MALSPLTLSTTQGVQGQRFKALIYGQSAGSTIEVVRESSPARFGVVNGYVVASSLPYAPTNTVFLKETLPGTGTLTTAIDIPTASVASLPGIAEASAAAHGATVRNYRVGWITQDDGSITYLLYVEDDLGATTPVGLGDTGPTDPIIFFDISEVSVAEGNSGTTAVTGSLNVVRNGVTGDLVANLSYGGTATSGVDYVAGPTTVTILSGQNSAAFNLSITGDTTGESDETITVSAVLAAYPSATASKIIDITNDDVGGAATVYRTTKTVTAGSSSFQNAHTSEALNIRGNATIVADRGTVWQTRAATLVPTNNGSVIFNINMAYEGGQPPGVLSIYETRIETQINAAIADGTITSTTKVIFGGSNSQTDATAGIYETDADIFATDLRIISSLQTAGVTKYMLANIGLTAGPRDWDNYSLWNRKQTYFLAHPDPYRGLYSFQEASMRIDAAYYVSIAYFLSEDIRQIAAQERPLSIVNDDFAHLIGTGYKAYGDYVAMIERGLEGGVPFLPTLDYFVRASSVGFLADIYYTGDLTGCTASVNDANYSVAIVTNANYPATDTRPKLLKLSAVTSLPTKSPTKLAITLTKASVSPSSETYNIRLHVSQRTGTASAKVRIRNGATLFRREPYGKPGGVRSSIFSPVGNTRKLTMVWIIKMEEDDGGATAAGVLSGAPGGTSDTRNHYFMQFTSEDNRTILTMRRGTNGVMTFTCLDSTANGTTNAINVGTSTSGGVGLFRKDQGMRAYFLSYDADQPSKCAVYSSPGHLISNGAAYGLDTKTINIGGNGTLGLGRYIDSGDQLRLFASDEASDKNGGSRAEFTKGAVWIAPGQFIDFSVQANRDLFFNSTTQVAVDPGVADGTVGGITPLIWLPGDAAELAYGGREISPTDAYNGGVNCKNYGSGAGFMSYIIGELQTV
jgi:hypothetical protein